MEPLETLAPAAQAAAAVAGQMLYAQLHLKGSNPEQGYKKAGLPPTGRVLVVIGYQGCNTHDFEKLERLADKNNAKLYVINGAPEAPDAATPSITVGNPPRPLKGTIITPKISGALAHASDIVTIANEIGLAALLQTSGIATVKSSGFKVFEHGKLIEATATAELTNPIKIMTRA